MSEADAIADRLFDVILDRYPLDASLMGFDVDHESLTDHGEEAGSGIGRGSWPSARTR
ncbi:hypothetical protein OG205_30885 [Lentzea sp. NBC_00516]|uniref:hypothetical protein n=1 Tax=Lentzea sp. NBC_00516 TaxID=2903582 RepID=UPI002E81F45E|nr:hypothetical protein [Lentzea sp. NBC_00516]WUD22477.1 hypothetical protein OG205_30885 [Lentzea sp. NBC_00516]